MSNTEIIEIVANGFITFRSIKNGELQVEETPAGRAWMARRLADIIWNSEA